MYVYKLCADVTSSLSIILSLNYFSKTLQNLHSLGYMSLCTSPYVVTNDVHYNCCRVITYTYSSSIAVASTHTNPSLPPHCMYCTHRNTLLRRS